MLCKIAFCLLLLLGVTTRAGAARLTATACSPVGVDTSTASLQAAVFLGEAIGQTFFATDTLVASITVWRPAPFDTGYAGWHLYLFATDSLGMPDRQQLILNGPTVYNYFGDGVHPIAMRFVFDPPLSLPRPGEYEMAFHAEPCDGQFYFLYDNRNHYPDGSAWLHGRSGCLPRSGPEGFPLLDMIFEIVFCDPSTPARSSSWGEVKARYR